MSDITERLRFDAVRCYLEFSKGVAGNINAAANEIERLRAALEKIALLDEADGHELTVVDAMEAVAIATSTLGMHPSEILSSHN